MNWLDPNLDWMEYAKSKGVEGFLHPSEITRLVQLSEGKDYCEIGSFRGLSAWCVAHVANHVTCIDTFCANSAGQVQMPEQTTYQEFRRNLAPFEAKLTCLPFSSERANELMAADATFDVIFLDAFHSYEEVKADVGRWWPRVRLGGVLACHDYKHWDFPGVHQALDEIFGPIDDRGHLVTLRVIRKWYDGSSGRAVAMDGSLWDSIEDMQRFGLEPFPGPYVPGTTIPRSELIET